MGMDLYGVAPFEDEGAYFRNNVWYWRPLWEYVAQTCELPDEVVEGGSFNDGYEVDGDMCEEIADRLTVALESGHTEAYQTEFRKWQSDQPLEECRWCAGTGVRTDDVGREMGMPEKELDAHAKVMFGRSHGWCNACEGAGKVSHASTWYHFDVTNVREFRDFVRVCGGFTVC